MLFEADLLIQKGHVDLKTHGKTLPSLDTQKSIARWIMADSSRHSFRYTLDKKGSRPALALHYVARHADAMDFLKGTLKNSVSLEHYDQLLDSPNGSTEFLLGIPNDIKARRWKIVKAIFDLDPKFSRTSPEVFRDIARRAVNKSLEHNFHAIRERGSIDAIRQYAIQALYFSTQEFSGLSSPTKPAFLVRLFTFFRNRGKAHKVSLKGEAIGAAQLLLWTQMIFGHVFSNVGNRNSVLRWGSKYALKKYHAWIAQSIAQAEKSSEIAIIARAKKVRHQFPDISDNIYDNDIANIVLELAGASFILVGISFGNLMETLYAHDHSITSILKEAKAENTGEYNTQFIDEALRLTPTTGMLTRIVTRDFDFYGKKFRKGDNVILMLSNAMRDPGAFPQPDIFSDFSKGSPNREMTNYLNFGPNEVSRNAFTPSDGTHPCFGQYWARELLLQLLIGLERFGDLKPAEQMRTFFGTPDHFNMTFSDIQNESVLESSMSVNG